MSKIVNVTNDNFEQEIEKSEKLVVVDFWAGWCGPCKNFAPVFDEVSGRKDELKFVKIDVEEAKELAQRYGVRGIPFIALMDKGEIVASKSGNLSAEAFESWLEAVVE